MSEPTRRQGQTKNYQLHPNTREILQMYKACIITLYVIMRPYLSFSLFLYTWPSIMLKASLKAKPTIT
ncbi:hypothetical protein L596_006117 [Steinernema carpocapsae]|uniref:Uncharacterized protein n=1 Tax=Steinernema carpocapsae TaxID=34508 RepID=A0A4U8V2H8_STECR|nr:hypothetical protein L596_006117 [Steinernema carpocapsae]